VGVEWVYGGYMVKLMKDSQGLYVQVQVRDGAVVSATYMLDGGAVTAQELAFIRSAVLSH
jgi:purine nucleoside permease